MLHLQANKPIDNNITIWYYFDYRKEKRRDVLNDIDTMFENLSTELDAMLDIDDK